MPEANPHVVEVREARRTWRAGKRERHALAGVSFQLARGEWTALLGPNGAGKSTLLRILAALDTPDQGEARLFGEPVGRQAAAPAVRRRLGVVHQRAALDPLLTVRENLRAQGALFGLDRRESRARAEDVAARLGVAERLDDRVARLSGGLTRRADLARALLTTPDLLLLDEPTTGLDHAARLAYLDALEQERARRGPAILMSTHLLDEAERADRVLMLSEGRIVADGAPEELKRSLGDEQDVMLRCAPDAAEALAKAGLATRRAGGEVLAAAPRGSEALRRALEALAASGASAQIGPPTLADVYAARTQMEFAEAAPEADAGEAVA